MRLGFVLTSNPNRGEVMDRSFRSLIKTNTDFVTEFYQGQAKPERLKPVLLIVHAGDASAYEYYRLELQKTWNVWMVNDEPGVVGVNRVFAHFGDKLINAMDITHIGFLVDDFVYNPEWLQELTKLIKRNPDGIAWSVYRSRYTRHHWIVGGNQTDVLMSMHDCIGTMTREEWIAFGASKISDFTCPPSLGGGSTIDIYHAASRPGNRWATKRDYMQNLGRHRGIEHLDCAIDFVGE